MKKYKKPSKLPKKKKISKLAKQKNNVSSRYWLKQADKLWSEIIRLHGKCDICNSVDNLNAHHLLDRSIKKFRHEIICGVCVCAKCHKYSRHLSAHKSGVAFAYWLSINKPDQYKWVIEHYMEEDNLEPNYKEAFDNLKRILDNKKE